MALTASVLGASGYSGAELTRLLIGHPALEVAALAGDRSVGRTTASVLPHLGTAFEGTISSVAEAAALGVDVCFSCLPSGALADLPGLPAAKVVVDLSDDHRTSRGWLYGLTEAVRGGLPDARLIANPGCYPTAALTALLPFVRAGIVGSPVIVDAMSGTSGAGRRPEDHLSFSHMHGNMNAYGTTEHRHVSEMERYLAEFGGTETTVSFTPHLVPVARGLLATARIPLAEPLGDVDAIGILREAYPAEPFIEVVEGWPSTGAVVGSNRVQVGTRVDARNGYLIACAAIDNLGKGAAGQAIQNANLALGIEETTGLSGVGVWP